MAVRAAGAPQTLVWLWDRPQRFTELPPGMGAAYLHATVQLSGTKSRTRYRQWPLRIAPGVLLMPVVHVALDNLQPSPLDAGQQRAIGLAVAHAAAHSRSGWVQLDFEARRSQREGYLALLQSLQPLRPSTRLSVTALASWCMDDPWLPAASVDEIVPMFFRMGRDSAAIRERLATRGAPVVAGCRGAAGVLFGEAPIAGPRAHRRYVFHPKAWTTADLHRIDNDAASGRTP